MHAKYLAGRLRATSVSFQARYTGLRGRRLSQWANPTDHAWGSGFSKDDTVDLSTNVAIEALAANLVEVVQSLLAPLYARFEFTKLPVEIVQRELNRLSKRE